MRREPGYSKIVPQHMNTLRAELHTALNELVDAINQGIPGGEHIIQVVEDNKVFRLTLCDFTNERLCGHCGGTGLRDKEQTASRN